MHPGMLILTIAGAGLLAGCRMRTEDAGMTTTSPASSSEAAGRGSVDSSVSRDAQETMSPGELERELDRLEQELGPDARPSGGQHAGDVGSAHGTRPDGR
jgi:hypothetical protein